MASPGLELTVPLMLDPNMFFEPQVLIPISTTQQSTLLIDLITSKKQPYTLFV
jgi:hypothetical protein